MTMKELILTVVLALVGTSCVFAQTPKKDIQNFSLKGKLINRDAGSICLSYLNLDGKEIKDTATVKNGIFSFSGAIGLPTRATLTGSVKSRSVEDPDFIELFLEPGSMTIAVTAHNFKQAKISGSGTQADVEKLNKQKEPISKKRDSLYAELQKLNEVLKNGIKSPDLNAKKELIVNQSKMYKDAAKHLDYKFIVNHPNSYLSPYLMGYYFGSRQLTLDSAVLFFNGFVPAVQKSGFGKSIKAEIDGRKLSAVGSKAPLFSKKDIHDKDVDLASFKGKYVLLDFWASWCVPCREFTPKVKDLYQKYQNKGLEIISISWDDNLQAWKKAVAEEQTVWYNVIARMSEPNDGSMRTKYSIPYIPTLILIDTNGVIVGRFDNSDDGAALTRKMEEIF